MKTVNLVVLTGYPHSGKTEVAKFLVKYGFVRLELDEIRKELFGRGWPHVTDKTEREARLTLQFRKVDLLAEGKSVIIDSCAINNTDRLENFFTPSFVSKQIKLKKFLIYLDVDRKVLIKRNLDDKSRSEKFREAFKTIDKYWQDPKTYKSKQGNVKLLVYKNNTKQDLEKIKMNLRKLLK